ncbi:MAG: YcfA-like protein [Syntrophorhabdus sp. PtaU1.Bin050]|jgi:predicted RNA binding protein YcfA (HicA-like mRNA interferase family)|nr:MAG: YcfA-like protein [Syntrophorhabdus sp. PtaU1.Bin050]
MAIEDISTLHDELPELFQDRDIGNSWYDEFVIIPVANPERIGGAEQASISANWSDHNDRQRAPTGQHLGNEDAEGDILKDVGPDLILADDDPPELSPILGAVLGGAHSGAPIPYTHQPMMPPPDCFAFYLPFHYYHPDWWGVYLLYDGVLWLAGQIQKLSGETVSHELAFQAAHLFLYYHEAFHHQTECFATRLELTHRRAFFKTGFERYYQTTFGTDDCLEEGLANASALFNCYQKSGKSKILDAALVKFVEGNPPGYNRGDLIRREFVPVRCRFAEENQQISLPHLPAKNPDVWKTAPHMFDGISNIKGRVNYVIPRSSPIAKRLPFRPCVSPNKLKEKLKELVGLEFVKQGGNHEIWKTSTGKRVTIPRHPRDLGRGLLRKILHEVELDMGLERFLSL